jgi:hypothetical protein
MRNIKQISRDIWKKQSSLRIVSKPIIFEPGTSEVERYSYKTQFPIQVYMLILAFSNIPRNEVGDSLLFTKT